MRASHDNEWTLFVVFILIFYAPEWAHVKGGSMPKVETNRAKIVDRLEKDGWRLARHGGEHDIYSRSGAVIVVPRHRELSPGVARKIAKVAAWG